MPLVTRGLLYSPLIYLSRVGRSITAQVGLFFGSTWLALVPALVLNGHLDQWVLSRKVSFERPPLRHSAAAQMEVANQGVESLEAI